MATITKKKMYRDLMRMDGARMRDLNPKSKADLAMATAGPILKTGAKVVSIAALAGATGMAMMSCDDKPKTPDPKCDCTNNVHNGACPAPCPGKGINPPCDCRDPNPCLCPDQANHLANGESKSCVGEPCKHTCTEQTATIGAIPVTKNVGVTVTQMDAAVGEIGSAYGDFDTGQKNKFATKVTEIRIMSGNSISLSGTILMFGCGASEDDLVDYLFSNNFFAQLQHQPKTEWLASNKGRGWVAEYMETGAIVRVNAFDKARGISI